MTTNRIIAIILALITSGYMLPFAVALWRGQASGKIFWVNLLLGWTIIGWVIALIWALR